MRRTIFTPALIAHGGAGGRAQPAERPARRRGLIDAVELGAGVLREGGSALDAVIATVSATLGPTAQLLQDKAEARGKKVNVSTELCKGAFEALHNKDVQTHDRLVMDAIRRNAQTADVIVLAQASMARIVPELGNQVKIPVLTSLKSGIEQVKPVLAV